MPPVAFGQIVVIYAQTQRDTDPTVIGFSPWNFLLLTGCCFIFLEFSALKSIFKLIFLSLLLCFLLCICYCFSDFNISSSFSSWLVSQKTSVSSRGVPGCSWSFGSPLLSPAEQSHVFYGFKYHLCVDANNFISSF